jgi:uncharacterized tellurite resistance protein B-like protein
MASSSRPRRSFRRRRQPGPLYGPRGRNEGQDEAMKAHQLTREEQLALVALLKLVVRADHGTSVGESVQLHRSATELGGLETWTELAAEAESRFSDEAALQRHTATVTRRKARRFIFSRLVETARSCTIVEEEARILRWIADLWGIDQRW